MSKDTEGTMSSPSPPTAQCQPQRPLNPEMVYRPLTPQSTSHVLSAVSSHSSDPDDPRHKLRISIVSLLRSLVAILTFIDWIFWARLRETFGNVFMTLVFVELIFLFVWTVAVRWAFFKNGSSVFERLCPAGGVSCQVGPLKCILLGQDDDDDDENGPPKKRKGRTWTLSWVVDLYFAVTLLVFGTVDLDGYDWWRVSQRHPETSILLYLIVSFEFVITVFTLLAIYLKSKSFPILLYADQIESADAHEYRIRLPEEQDVRALRQQPISVAA
ncbi:hypothetical protein GE09DRAFT_288018 [Coniochaeta sp. 2T2.1]|nr:hypothetical protein GE09DRAFT_288018 [Coniochaeta sp. 2T2.1]